MKILEKIKNWLKLCVELTKFSFLDSISLIRELSWLERLKVLIFVFILLPISETLSQLFSLYNEVEFRLLLRFPELYEIAHSYLIKFMIFFIPIASIVSILGILFLISFLKFLETRKPNFSSAFVYERIPSFLLLGIFNVFVTLMSSLSNLSEIFLEGFLEDGIILSVLFLILLPIDFLFAIIFGTLVRFLIIDSSLYEGNIKDSVKTMFTLLRKKPLWLIGWLVYSFCLGIIVTMLMLIIFLPLGIIGIISLFILAAIKKELLLLCIGILFVILIPLLIFLNIFFTLFWNKLQIQYFKSWLKAAKIEKETTPLSRGDKRLAIITFFITLLLGIGGLVIFILANFQDIAQVINL